MLLSVRQYAIIFAFIIISLILAFSYKINSNLNNTQQEIENSQKKSAETELKHAINLTFKNIQNSASTLSQWQEVRQQIENPEIFAYWYSVRFKQLAFELQKHTSDLMLYDITGNALTKLNNSTLPYSIDINGIDKLTFRITSPQEIIYISPIFNANDDKQIIGYISTQLQTISLLKTLSPFHYIELDSLVFKDTNKNQYINNITPEMFYYRLHKTEGIILLEKQMRSSLINLILVILIPTLLLYTAIIYIVGTPMKEVEKYIDILRTSPDQANKNKLKKIFRVKELMSIYDSLNTYHAELIQKEEHLSLTLNSIGDAVITTDDKNNIVRMNPVAEQLTGWSLEEAFGEPIKNIFKIINASNRTSIKDPFSCTLKNGETLHLSKDIILISKNNREYHISDSAAPIRDAEKNIRGIVLVFNDITEQKLKDEQLQHSLKMDALGKLTGGIAHDFNNLLGIILGYAELLTLKFTNQPEQLESINRIYNAGERARKLTTKLLAFSRKQVHDLSITDINELILSEQHMLEKTLTARIELNLNLSKDLWPVHIDKSLLQDAILNICINAMHAMPDGGSLSISTENIHFDDIDQKFTELDTGDYIQISITDTGVGMNSETRKKVFDPFFTTKGDKGTGLGMCQVYGFVQLSGGTLHVYSEQGIGTRISIYLPRYQASNEENNKTNNSDLNVKKIPSGTESILIVDDEESLLELSSQILSTHGYTIHQSNNGEDALKILEQHHIDLLLSDVIMPKMDGLQLAKEAKKLNPKLKIQLISGFSDNIKNKDQDNLLQKQLNKPFSSLQLLQKVREILDT